MALRPLMTVLIVFVLAACGGGGGSGGSTTSGSGSLRLALTDAPACGYDEVNVTVERVRVHQSDAARDSDGGWSEVVLSPPKRVNLLTLTNGVLLELGQTALPAGRYNQLRLVLGDNDKPQGDPMANSVKPTLGAEVALKTPSAQQSGLKLKTSIDVAADQMADFVLDFDACKSIVKAGNSGQYILKPVLRVIPRALTGVVGQVDASLANGSTTLALQQGGVTLRSTMPTSSGTFMLQPVDPGTYTFVLTAPGRAVAVVKGVGVPAGQVVRINPALAPLNPPVSPSGTVIGTVTVSMLTGSSTVSVSPVDASVRALQQLTGGPQLELVARPVDGDTGQYRYVLSVAAPQVASHSAGAAPVFAPDTAAAGQISLQALTGDSSKSIGPFSLSDGGTVVTNFSFP